MIKNSLFLILLCTLTLMSAVTASDHSALPYGTIEHGVSAYGQLKVTGTQLCDENGTPVILRGMSSHGIQWFPEYTSIQSVKNTRDYGANIFRIAMYTMEGGYIHNQEVRNVVIDAINSARALDMYVIIDWHILSDGDPNLYLEQARQFFGDMAKRYAGDPAVIYELCNEPNGVSWDTVYAYATEIIPAIREQSPDALILCGSGTWSQDVDLVAERPLPYHNIMYSYHFYSGFHGEESRQQVSNALAAGTPVFVTEWGTSYTNGDDGVYLEEAAIWLDFLNTNRISWINWSLCDKDESSAALLPEVSPDTPWTMEDLSASGQFVFRHFQQ